MAESSAGKKIILSVHDDEGITVLLEGTSRLTADYHRRDRRRASRRVNR